MFDPTRLVRTRCRYEVRIYATDGGGEYPIHGAYRRAGVWQSCCWPLDGRFGSGHGEHPLDLFNVPKKFRHVQWANVYADGSFGMWPTRSEADRSGRSLGRIACVEVVIEGEEGQGL